MDSHVIFEGPGPFHLPLVQLASAVGVPNSGVTATIYCLASKRVRGVEVRRGKEPESICFHLTSALARDLADQLLRAAARADRPPRK
jgi:hypothetical protein